ncbi:MAG: hypothetical protein SOT80_04615 [Candidatus Pseudoruminococcus sp.]|uniref:hypothetical protein n=1 Tax=Candidatus Pseudoruminococcus sp. TaxID=3101048 RepID=UPI002A7D39AE|nr:hypothetical protein [Ruminococcus sp.]MDY2782671.1 hypothetical protein [Candidatus Pseudoruminococcus sp.]
MKKMPVLVLLALIIILFPFIMLIIQMGNNSELMNSKNNIIENYSKYEEKLKENGYKTKLVTENGEKYLIVYEDHVTYKFNKLNSCTAEFSNKDVASQKYTCKMYVKNIGESTVNVTLNETYQNTEIDFSCNYSSNGFDTIIADTPNYDRNDREIKEMIEGDYKLSAVYAQMKNINTDLKNISKEK